MKISIIIPVYNGEKHIELCMNKVLKQLNKNIEVLVINDGSTDSTLEIIKKYSNYDNIKIYNKKNTGVSDTRNFGIRKATGDYIMFLDSDDFYVEDAIEKILNFISQNKNLEVVVFGYKVLGSTNRKTDSNTLKGLTKKINGVNLLEKLCDTTNNIYGYIWRCLYSKNFLEKNKVEFKKNIKISEDYLFLAEVFSKAENCAILKEELYIYNINDSSMSIKYIPTLKHDMFYVNEYIINNILCNFPKIIEIFECNYLNSYLRFVQNEVKSKKIIFEILSDIYSTKRQKNINARIKKLYKMKSHFDKKTFISLLMFKYNLEPIYILMFNIKIKLCGGSK